MLRVHLIIKQMSLAPLSISPGIDKVSVNSTNQFNYPSYYNLYA